MNLDLHFLLRVSDRQQMLKESSLRYSPTYSFFSALIISIVLFIPLDSVKNKIQLRAMQIDSEPAFVASIESYEDFDPLRHKSLFGWGGMGNLNNAVQNLGSQIHICRQFRASSEDTLIFDVKVDAQKPGLKVVGLLQGMKTNEAMIRCVRNRINALKVVQLSTLQNVNPDTYRLKIAVRSAVGVDSNNEIKE